MTTAAPERPTVTYYGWFPATVLLPRAEPGAQKALWHTCRVYITDAGLVVYRRRPIDAETPAWSSAVDFEATRKPVSGLPGYAHDVHTEAGLVVVTQSGGCGCGTPLKGWRPEFSRRVAAWPA